MKILLSAYACEPNRGSEVAIGWSMARELARDHEVCVLTSHTHQANTDAELALHPVDNLRVVYLDPFRWSIDWSHPRGVYLHYYLWQVWAYFVARRLHRATRFDVVHHLTYAKYSIPSYLAFLPVPFLMGPVGGGESTPKAFWSEFSPKARAYEYARAVSRRVGEWDPFLRLAFRRSALVWAATDDTAQRVRKVGCRRVETSSGIAIEQAERQMLEQLPAPDPGPMRFIGIGRLRHFKGFHLALRAFALAAPPGAEYWIVGDGPEREPLEALTAELGIADRVKFLGAIDRAEVLATIGKCHALLLPALHESGGMVFLETMAAGRPVICANLGGAPVQVSEDCGVRVDAKTPKQMVEDLAAAITLLDGDRELCARMGAAGTRRVAEHLSWEGHAARAVREYEQATGPSS